MSDGGIDIQMPPMPQGVRNAIDVMAWKDCTLDPITTAALWGTNRPMTLDAGAKPWCRQKSDAGLPCLLTDGGRKPPCRRNWANGLYTHIKLTPTAATAGASIWTRVKVDPNWARCGP